MTHSRVARRREHLTGFATIGVCLIVVIAAGVHALFSTAPLWMAVTVTMLPALLIADGCFTLADRWGCLRTETADRRGDDDADATSPRWVSWVGSLLLSGVGGWFEGPWYDSWHHIYPSAPGWMVFVVMLELAAIAVVGVEYALAKIVEQVRGTAGARRASVRA